MAVHRQTALVRRGPISAARVGFFLLALLMGFGLTISQAPARGAPDSFADLAEKVIDSVVNISTSQTVTTGRSLPVPEGREGSPFQDFFDKHFRNRGRNRHRVQSLGSGFVIDPAGYIVTNNHVIDKADEIYVNFNDGSKLKAELVGHDSKTDLALLKVKSEKPLKFVRFGDSKVLRVGDWVMAIGNPFGLGGTVTAGIVSARSRNINSGPYDNFIQTDAAINRGNSGGPLFNLEGEVVGINTAIISPSGGSIGIGFSVPTEIAAGVIQQLRQFGTTRRGWLGVNIQEVNEDIAESLEMGKARGALVSGVSAGGPAEKAGLKTGDVILKFNGQEVPRMRDLPRMVATTSVGAKVPVEVLRGGETVTLQVELGRLEDFDKLKKASVTTEDDNTPAEPSVATAETLGMTLSPLTDVLRKKYNIDEAVQGVVVSEVDPAGKAAEKRIRQGQVILEVAQEPVYTPEDVAKQVKKIVDGGRDTVLFKMANARGEVHFIAVRVK